MCKIIIAIYNIHTYLHILILDGFFCVVPIIIGNIINRVILEKNCKSKKLKKILKNSNKHLLQIQVKHHVFLAWILAATDNK